MKRKFRRRSGYKIVVLKKKSENKCQRTWASCNQIRQQIVSDTFGLREAMNQHMYPLFKCSPQHYHHPQEPRKACTLLGSRHTFLEWSELNKWASGCECLYVECLIQSFSIRIHIECLNKLLKFVSTHSFELKLTIQVNDQLSFRKKFHIKSPSKQAFYGQKVELEKKATASIATFTNEKRRDKSDKHSVVSILFVWRSFNDFKHLAHKPGYIQLNDSNIALFD